MDQDNIHHPRATPGRVAKLSRAVTQASKVRWVGVLQLVMSGDFRAGMSLFLFIVNAAEAIIIFAL